MILNATRFVLFFYVAQKYSRLLNDTRDKCMQRAPIIAQLFLFIVQEIFVWSIVEFRIVVYVIDVERVLREREREREGGRGRERGERERERERETTKHWA